MKFIVCVKLTPDTEQLADVQPEKVGTGDLGVTMVLNPWDEFAVEEALQLAERYDGEAVAMTMGTEDSVEALKRAVAMGVEEAVLLSDPTPSTAAMPGARRTSWPRRSADQGDYTLVLTGKQSVDGNSGMVGPGVAGKLGVPFVSNVDQDRGCDRRQRDRAAHAGRGHADGEGAACRRSSRSATRSTSRATRTSWASARRPHAVSRRRRQRPARPGRRPGRRGRRADQVDRSAQAADADRPVRVHPGRHRRPSRPRSWPTS